MDAPSNPTLDVNHAAVDMAIEMLGLALRSERGNERDPGHGQLLRARLSSPAAPDVLRERVRYARYGAPSNN